MSRVLALTGGVGGAKLALGLTRVVDGAALVVICNTGDDFEHLGLHVCPDLDSVMYALAGKNDEERGWGRADEGWRFMESLRELGAEDWFQLGDRDLAVHVERSRRLSRGESLSEATSALCSALGIEARVAPMTDDPVRTIVETEIGALAFQHYFVRERCEPAARAFLFDGIERATPSPTFSAALADDDRRATIVCPSNPYVSVDPVLALPGVEAALRASTAPLIAVSPIVGGQALKGPAAKMMKELGKTVSPVEVARHYASRELLDGFVLDVVDAELQPQIEALHVPCLVEQTVMRSLEDRTALAASTLAFADELRAR